MLEGDYFVLLKPNDKPHEFMVPAFNGQIAQHKEFGEIEIRHNEELGWHYLRKGYASYGCDWDNVKRGISRHHGPEVSIETGIDSQTQSSSFQNGTLQGIGSGIAATVQTYVKVPKDVTENGTLHEVASWLNTKLTSIVRDNPEFSFEVQVGKDLECGVKNITTAQSETSIKGTMPLNLKGIIDGINQQPQRQDSSEAQLVDLYVFANKLGLYDAADTIKRLLHDPAPENTPHTPKRVKP